MSNVITKLGDIAEANIEQERIRTLVAGQSILDTIVIPGRDTTIDDGIIVSRADQDADILLRTFASCQVCSTCQNFVEEITRPRSEHITARSATNQGKACGSASFGNIQQRITATKDTTTNENCFAIVGCLRCRNELVRH